MGLFKKKQDSIDKMVSSVFKSSSPEQDVNIIKMMKSASMTQEQVSDVMHYIKEGKGDINNLGLNINHLNAIQGQTLNSIIKAYDIIKISIQPYQQFLDKNNVSISLYKALQNDMIDYITFLSALNFCGCDYAFMLVNKICSSDHICLNGNDILKNAERMNISGIKANKPIPSGSDVERSLIAFSENVSDFLSALYYFKLSDQLSDIYIGYATLLMGISQIMCNNQSTTNLLIVGINNYLRTQYSHIEDRLTKSTMTDNWNSCCAYLEATNQQMNSM